MQAYAKGIRNDVFIPWSYQDITHHIKSEASNIEECYVLTKVEESVERLQRQETGGVVGSITALVACVATVITLPKLLIAVPALKGVLAFIGYMSAKGSTMFASNFVTPAGLGALQVSVLLAVFATIPAFFVGLILSDIGITAAQMKKFPPIVVEKLILTLQAIKELPNIVDKPVRGVYTCVTADHKREIESR
tara:strand:- start:85 stop:663 length:579 start_codon:yes stop_codon:yes gene_type:complete